LESSHGLVGGSGWYEEGSLVTLYVTPPNTLKQDRGEGVVFARWSEVNGGVEAYNGTQRVVVVKGPMTVNANWYTVEREQNVSHLIYFISDALAGFTLILSVYFAVRERRKFRKRNNV